MSRQQRDGLPNLSEKRRIIVAVVSSTSTVGDCILNSLVMGQRISWKVLTHPCPFIRLVIISVTRNNADLRFAAGASADLNIVELKYTAVQGNEDFSWNPDMLMYDVQKDDRRYGAE